MNPRNSKQTMRSMIPNYYIQQDTSTKSSSSKTKRSSKRKSDMPFYGGEQYTNSLKIVDKSQLVDKLTQYMIVALVVILIMFALSPICIVIIKKWKWKWLISLFNVQCNEMQSSMSTSVVTNDIMSNGTGMQTIVSPTAHYINTISGGNLAKDTSDTITVNTTGTGIDLTKQYNMTPNVLKEFTAKM